MDKINSIGIQQSQMQVMQEMQRMAASTGSTISPASSLTNISQTSNVGFAQVMDQAVNNVDRLQHSASEKQMAVDMGLSDDLMGTMVESQKATIAFSAMVEVRNKLNNALDQVMNISM